MCRRSRSCVITLRAVPRALCAPVLVAALLGTALLAAPAALGDDVERYLEQHGLTRLLVRHLERRMEEIEGDDRSETLRRLADLYAQLLETESDAERRAELEERSRRLVAQAPAGATDALRLALLRATYRAAETAAENHRLGLVGDADVEVAQRTLGDLIPLLNGLRDDLDERVKTLDRRLDRAAGVEAIVLQEELEKAEQLRASAIFLGGWAQYYQSWLNRRPDNARVAQELFASVLDLDGQPALPEFVTVDLRSVEAVARSILGMALCKSLTAPSSSAMEWLDLLDHPQAFEPLRTQLPAWRMVVHLEHGEYEPARAIIEAEAGAAPLPWLRLLAVGAMRAQDRSSRASELARFALTRLAARGELGQVFDLAERFGTESLGSRGFAMRYVRGAIAFYRAREAHGSDEPTLDPTVAARFDAARADIAAALAEPDASAYLEATPDCRRLIAWCHYFAGRLLAAATAFEEAAEVLPAGEAPDALWMAIVCLDRLVEADPRAEALADRLAALTARFLAEHPGHAQAPRLVLRRALRSDELDPAAVDELLAIPPESDVYAAARKRAAQILYRLFRAAEVDARPPWGIRFLEVAVPIQDRERGVLDLADGESVQAWIVRGRRILEVALGDGIEDAVAAHAILDDMDELAADGVDLSGIADELAYRRVRERLIAGAESEAAAAVDAMLEKDATSSWSRLATRAVFAAARDRWIERDRAGGDERLAVDLVLRYGAHVIAEYAADPEALSAPAILAAYATVAEAAYSVWERSGDRARGEEAFALYLRLLAVRPQNGRFLRATAMLAEPFGDRAQALTCWRTLVAGSPVGTQGWFEAKFNLARLVARDDAARGLEMLEQHRALHPEWGPEPWGARLKAMAMRLEAELASAPNDEADGASGEAPSPPSGLPAGSPPEGSGG